MESGIDIVTTITAAAAVTLAVALVLLTVQFALWRALRVGVADAPAVLVTGRGLMPTALVAAGAAALIGVLLV